MPTKHATLSPSASNRWLACPPSAELNAKVHDEGSPYAAEGTCAHALAEFKVRTAVGEKAEDPRENLDYLDAEMDEATDDYRDFILELLAEAQQSCRDPTIMVEQRVSCDRWAQDCFGTADCIIISDDTLYITDFKYGQIPVLAQRNPQMMIYALGAIDAFSYLYGFTKVKMTIFQPRRNHVDTYETTVAELLDWGENELKPKAKLAAEGKGEFTAGDHCRFCKVRANCRKRAEYNLILAQYDFAPADTLDNTEIALILDKADGLVSWVNDIKEYALKQAISGVEFNGYKVVEGRSVRKYTDESVVASVVAGSGYEPYEKKLLGITAMERQLGKKKFSELLGQYIEKPSGKPTLVPMSDKRPSWNTAKNDFMEEQ